ncbi:DUF551 domain-containing protein [Yersinia vastinensis]|uniref:DUF551 domain-containing protein n=1 Tax=Yersinia vastinensis TaxID=2890318 RepID=UPI0011A5F1DB|nr:DUF551 domain-containing protein [Yersinia vastinensis]
MKDLDSFTVERLEEIIAEEGYSAMITPKNDEVRALARIALAAKRAEPVGYLCEWDNGNQVIYYGEAGDALDDDWSSQPSVHKNLPIYTTPQLNSPEIPEGWIKCSERRPERGTDVQVYCSDTREQFVAFHIGNGEFQYAQHEDTSIACRPSHWMPLPAAPEKPL